MTNAGAKNTAGGLNRERRVAALEAVIHRHEPVESALICAQLSESSEAAVARHVAETGSLPLVRVGQINAIVLMPVEPAPRAAA